MSVVVTTCYFNPAGYKNNLDRFKVFKKGLEAQDVPLYTIELAHGDQPFELSAGPNVVQLRTQQVLWQKERLLNLLIRQLPPQYDKVAWIDADLLFDRPDWAQRLDKVLDDFPVAQTFKVALLSPQPTAFYPPPPAQRPSVAYMAANRIPGYSDLGTSHPGFAWAARRDFLDKHGLYDAAVMGEGDVYMVTSFYNWLNHRRLHTINDAMRRHLEQWAKPVYADVRGRVGYIDDAIRHIWHGTNRDRRYSERIKVFVKENFDPNKDMGLDDNGLWCWTTDKPALHQGLEDYFTGRREDG